MKITKSQLEQIIKEEIQSLLEEGEWRSTEKTRTTVWREWCAGRQANKPEGEVPETLKKDPDWSMSQCLKNRQAKGIKDS